MRCKTIVALLICVALLALPVSASGSEDLLAVLTEGDVQTWVSETLPSQAGNGAEWYAIALTQSETNYDFSEYAAALTAYFDTEKIGSAVERQRIALALLAIGAESTIPDEVASESVGKQGVMSLVFGLHLLQNGAASDIHTVQSITAELLARQNDDGGWCVSGTRSDADVTAMVLQALAAQQETQSQAIERALACLSEMQKEDASFASYGVSNAESCCQVIIALTALGIDPKSDARFVKNGKTVTDALEMFRLADDTFAHAAGGQTNSYACQQVLLAFVALERFASGKGGLYVFDQNKPAVPDGDSSADIPLQQESLTEPVSDVVSQPDSTASVPDSSRDGMSPLRIAVLVLAVLIGVLSGMYLLFAKK